MIEDIKQWLNSEPEESEIALMKIKKPLKVPINSQFGRLTVISEYSKDNSGCSIVLCRCSCGTERNYRVANLKNGNSKSCGCIANERISNLNKSHCMRYTAEYRAWSAMKKRCYNKNYTFYHRYGGRGITVCEEWINDFFAFFKDVGYRPSNKHTLDRKDNSKGYVVGNCKWSTQKEQCRNRSTNALVTSENRTYCIAEWIEILNANPNTFKKKAALYGNEYAVQYYLNKNKIQQPQ